MKNKLAPAALLISALFLPFSTGATEKTLVFSAIPDQDSSQLNQRFNKVATYLSKSLNVPVKYVAVTSYVAAITAFRNNQVQLAWFGGLSGVRARSSVPGSEAIAQGAEDTEFETWFIAHHSTGIKASEQFPDSIAGRNFTFGSKGSTSGRLMPEYFIRQHFKKAPSEVFKHVGFSGNHSRTIALVQSGAYQIGAVNYKVWQRELAAGKIDNNKVSVIWKTPHYPDYQWSVRGDIDTVWGAGFKARIKQALLNMKDPDLLAAFPRSAFISAKNNDYLPILNTAKNIGLME
ncbi:ABC transporter, substrate-binding protein (cluster 12, methionine/phosphonates) [hydrothermal vent metagenome]|uniref:ABC transporter, substrate-binding protein (Cluster 12, methionine/phosphonates) n=1 Tax=hydrothermal vent metagenome TaxID=652676 RepID=A0A3B0WWL4_9ZZZZ